ncbi:glycosyltransferase [Desulfotomaculum nigrificans]|uniref:glycosyltransferase n=1 Tax=Desulfotomaculum nigrificans TaxID=1565 RepID=UPI0001FADE59|nr:glycosyltransferase [Desulfotomaculum nigrificans]
MLNIMFIAHNIFPLEKSGVPIVTYNQVRELQKRGHRVAVMIPHSNDYIERTVYQDIIIYRIPRIEVTQWFLDDFFMDSGNYLALVERVKDDFKPDIVHINNLLWISPKVIELFTARGIPVIREMHDMVEFCPRGFPLAMAQENAYQFCAGPEIKICSTCLMQGERPTNELFRIKHQTELVIRFAARLAYINYLYQEQVAAIIYPSPSWQNYLHKFMARGKREFVIPIGLSYARTPEQNRDGRSGPVSLVYIGNIGGHKGTNLLIKAMQDPELLTRDFSLNIYGKVQEPGLLPEIKHLEHISQGRVKYHGSYSPEDLPTILDGADIGVVPSVFESFCLTAREFLIRGKPIIASPVYGISDIVQDGVNGLLFPIGDWQALRDKLRLVLADQQLLVRLAEGAQGTKVSVLWQEVDQLEGIYYEILGKPLPRDSQPRVSIIILTYNSMRTIKQCLASVAATVRPGDQVIVVDNQSTDGTREYLKSWADKFDIIYNAKNVGFSQGCNVGYQMARGDYIVLLNPDTIVTPGWLDGLLHHFTRGEIGAVGPVSNYVLAKQQFSRYLDESELSGQVDLPTLARTIQAKNQGRSVETELLVGFCLMLPRQVIEQVGLLDETLFLGCDDLELSWRLREQGYQLLVATDVFVYHHGHVSFATEPSELVNYLQHHSNYMLAHKLAKYYAPQPTPDPAVLWGVKIDFKPPRALTSIIIPCFNRLQLTKLCINSILAHTFVPFELILINNGSTDETKDYFNELIAMVPRVRVIHNRKNLGFGRACNQGMEIAAGDYMLILNNDVVVTDGWLSRMLAVGDAYKQIGIVGPLSNCVAGVQLVNNVPYHDLTGMHDFARQLAVQNATLGFTTIRVVGFCMLIKREVVEKIGGFDPRFGLGNFEDDDFCLRACIAGYQVWVAQDVFIHHFGGATFSSAGIDRRYSVEDNWEKFKDKWAIEATRSIFQGYNAAELVNRPFNREQHFCPLD